MIKVNVEINSKSWHKKIKNNKIENEKKFINVKLYGAKPSMVIAPRKNGAKNITKNLLLSKTDKLKSLF